jgi:hypothetical protein
MTNREVYAWATGILALGSLLAGTAALRLAPPSTLPAALAVYLALGGVVLVGGLASYGPAGALAALVLVALCPPVMIWAAAVLPSLAALSQVTAAYALMRCLLDPTVQWSLFTGLVIGVEVLVTAAGQRPLTGAVGVAAFSLLLIGVRTAAAAPGERRVRVAHAATIATALAWAIALSVLALVGERSTLPSPSDFGAAQPPAVQRAAFAAPAVQGMASGGASLETCLVAVLLAALRPWRRQRAYSDAAWLLLLGCMALPLWRAASEWPNAVVVMMPPLALLAGACWDASRPTWARRAATLALAVHVAIGVLTWLRVSPALPLGSALRPAAHAAEPS